MGDAELEEYEEIENIDEVCVLAMCSGDRAGGIAVYILLSAIAQTVLPSPTVRRGGGGQGE